LKDKENWLSKSSLCDTSANQPLVALQNDDYGVPTLEISIAFWRNNRSIFKGNTTKKRSVELIFAAAAGV